MDVPAYRRGCRDEAETKVASSLTEEHARVSDGKGDPATEPR